MHETTGDAICRNCSRDLSGEYCSHCGQAVHDGHTPSLAHVFHELTHEILHVDGKIFRTVRALLLQPGLLTLEYWNGRIVSWIRPLRLFLIAAALNLLLAPNTVGPVNFRLFASVDANGQRSIAIGQDQDAMARGMRAGSRAASEQEQQATYEKFRKIHSSIRYGSVVLFAFVVWVVCHSRQANFALQLVLGLHFYSFLYLLSVLGSLHPTLSKLIPMLGLVYLWLALRRVFAGGWLRTTVYSIVLMAAVICIELALGVSAASLS